MAITWILWSYILHPPREDTMACKVEHYKRFISLVVPREVAEADEN